MSSNKRQRVESSKVLFLRGSFNETQLKTHLSRFSEKLVVLVIGGKQAFVEFENEDQSALCMRVASATPLFINGTQVSIDYSDRTEVTKPPVIQNKVVLASFKNRVDITVDDLVGKMARAGIVEKMVIFHKDNRTQALVQYADFESAARAIDKLNTDLMIQGQVLEICRSKMEEVNVKFNGPKSYDYCNPELPSHHNDESNFRMFPSQTSASELSASNASYNSQHTYSDPNSLNYTNGYAGSEIQSIRSDQRLSESSGGVVIVHGIPAEATVNHLFNLFTCYGYVSKVKKLHKKEDAALVQFSGAYAAQFASNAVQYLNNATFLGGTLMVSPSKMSDLKVGPDEEHGKEFDGPSQRWPKDRYEQIQRSAGSPTPVLFLNLLDPVVTQEDIQALVKSPISAFRFLPQKNDKFNTALASFESAEEATDVLANLHNVLIHGRSIKVCFSKNSATA